MEYKFIFIAPRHSQNVSSFEINFLIKAEKKNKNIFSLIHHRISRLFSSCFCALVFITLFLHSTSVFLMLYDIELTRPKRHFFFFMPAAYFSHPLRPSRNRIATIYIEQSIICNFLEWSESLHPLIHDMTWLQGREKNVEYLIFDLRDDR